MDPEDKDDIMAKILADIESLPEEKRADALAKMVVCAMGLMSTDVVRNFRAKFAAAKFEESDGKDSPVLDLIDGHLALREIRDESIKKPDSGWPAGSGE